MTRRALVGWLLAVASGCESDGPVDPAWGKQPCAACAMVVSEPTSAAQLVTAAGERRYFDDLGCMAAYLHGQPLPQRAWVRGPDQRWTDARSARLRGGARTPMDYGFLPSPEGEFTWNDVTRAAAQRDTQP